MKTLALFLATTTSLGAAPAWAQTPASVAGDTNVQDQPGGGQDHLHDQPADIVVTAPFVRNLDLLAGTAVLSGEDLAREVRPQLGDTLLRLPGVSATSFSPGASRPVLRGFQGERVRVLTDGIGSIDVSNTSADHAVTIDPLTAERIEVLHGPAVLLFGSQAIGGAVNVFDRRIPRAIPDEAFHLDGLATYGSAADERSVGAGVDVPLGGGLVAHVDGSYRKTDDLRVGGFVLSERLRAEQREIAAEERAEGHLEEAEEAENFVNLRGRLPNSATETWTAAGGLALIREGGSLGVSVSVYDTRYGVPMRPGAGHHHEEGEEEGAEEGHEEGHGDENVAIDLRQYRADLRGEVELGGGFLERLRVRLGAADYEHTEFEGDEVGTVFRSKGLEGRFELVQADRGGWRGVTGGQLFTRDFSAVGAEAFLPPNQTEQYGLFTLQEIDLGALSLEAAGRYERTEVSSNTAGIERDFDAVSLAAGLSYEITPTARAGFNLSRAERAPSAEELFSNGPHIATQAFEIGDPNLVKERSLGGELFFRAQLPRLRFSGSLYYNRFDNFIFEAATGEEEDELPVFQYFQRDATYWGFEAGVSAAVLDGAGWRLVADGVADYTRATLEEDGGPLPRIPPLRLLGGLEFQTGAFDARAEVEHAFEQERVAQFETPTDGFTLVNASLTWRPWGRANPTSLTVSANNIFDLDVRRHASFTKDFVPQAGRDIRLAARVSF